MPSSRRRACRLSRLNHDRLPSAITRRQEAVVLRAVILALIAGYVDTVGYVHFNAFAGLMTGNTIFLGIEFATGQYGKAIFHGVIIFACLIGVIVARIKMRAGFNSWLALTVASALLIV